LLAILIIKIVTPKKSMRQLDGTVAAVFFFCLLFGSVFVCHGVAVRFFPSLRDVALLLVRFEAVMESMLGNFFGWCLVGG